jgi:hypothetical protein
MEKGEEIEPQLGFALLGDYVNRLPFGMITRSGDRSAFSDAIVRLSSRVCVEMQFKKAPIEREELDKEVDQVGYKSCLLLISTAGPQAALPIKAKIPNLSIEVPTPRSSG